MSTKTQMLMDTVDEIQSTESPDDSLIVNDSQYRDYYLSCNTHECKICDKIPTMENLMVHHVVGYDVPESLENLIGLCRTCHSRVHYGSDGYEEWHEKMNDTQFKG